MSKHRHRDQRKPESTQADAPEVEQPSDQPAPYVPSIDTPPMPMLPLYPVF